MSSRWSNGPGHHYPEHRHDFDKVLLAGSGSITFRLSERRESLELRAGDRLELPAGTLHGAEVGPLGVSCIEKHLPRGTLTDVRLHAGGAEASETATPRGA